MSILCLKKIFTNFESNNFINLYSKTNLTKECDYCLIKSVQKNLY